MASFRRAAQLLGPLDLFRCTVRDGGLLPLERGGAFHGVSYSLAGEHGAVAGADHGRVGHADEGIAALEVAAQVGEGQTGHEGRQPQCYVGHLHRHRGKVHTVDAAFEDEPPQQVAVLRLLHERPIVLAQLTEQLGNAGQAADLGEEDLDAVGNHIQGRRKEVGAAHCWVPLPRSRTAAAPPR